MENSLFKKEGGLSLTDKYSPGPGVDEHGVQDVALFHRHGEFKTWAFCEHMVFLHLSLSLGRFSPNLINIPLCVREF
jgi:hypothetical protein